MPVTLRCRSEFGHYQRPDPLVQAAKRMGMQPGSVKQLAYGRDDVFHRAAVIIEEMVKVGQGLRAERLLVPIDAARIALPTIPAPTTVRDENKVIEQAEDRAEVRYERDPTDENAQAWHARLRAENAHNCQLMRTLEMEHEI